MSGNSPQRFDLFTVCLHWLTASGYVGLFAIGWYMVELTYYDSLYNTLPSLHKSLGMLLLLIVPLQLVWRLGRNGPAPLPDQTVWQIAAARLMHWTLLVGTLGVLASGYLIPTAQGAGISVFDWFSVPAVVSDLPQQEDIAGDVHRYLSYAIGVLALGHTLIALKHHFYDGDATLRRILGLKVTDRTHRQSAG